MKSKMTAGEWLAHMPDVNRTHGQGDKRLLVLHPDGERIIADMSVGYISGRGEIPLEERRANCLAIAALPDCLAALAEIKALADAGVIHRNETGKPQWTLTGAVSELARAALAKAGVTP